MQVVTWSDWLERHIPYYEKQKQQDEDDHENEDFIAMLPHAILFDDVSSSSALTKTEFMISQVEEIAQEQQTFCSYFVNISENQEQQINNNN